PGQAATPSSRTTARVTVAADSTATKPLGPGYDYPACAVTSRGCRVLVGNVQVPGFYRVTRVDAKRGTAGALKERGVSVTGGAPPAVLRPRSRVLHIQLLRAVPAPNGVRPLRLPCAKGLHQSTVGRSKRKPSATA